MRITKHNIKVTNISEYSNALNRGSVFINPKFGSCWYTWKTNLFYLSISTDCSISPAYWYLFSFNN